MSLSMKVEKKGISAKTLGWIFLVIVGLISTALFISLFWLSNNFNRVQKSTTQLLSWEHTALDVKEASDYLTDQVRYYVFNHQKENMDNYFQEAKVNRRRDVAIEVIESYLPDTKVAEGVKDAVKRSNELMEDEFYAMRLIVESLHITMDSTYPDEVKNVVLSTEDIALSDEGKQDLALDYVLGEKYLNDKEYIIGKINDAIVEIDNMIESEVTVSTEKMRKILLVQRILISLNLAGIIAITIFIFTAVYKPVNSAIAKLQRNEKMEIRGAQEYRYFASVYNAIKDQNDNVKENLKYQAEHDQLTGLYNRTGYDAIYRKLELKDCFFILFDIDLFKSINDKFGHEIGDKVLVKVANAITSVLNKENEYIFRIGGDEFAAVIVNDGTCSTDQLKDKCEDILYSISHDRGILPNTGISIGIAKAEEGDTTDSLFKKADKAMYEVKKHGRHGVHVYGE